MKIGNTYFNKEEAVKMNFKTFDATYKNVLRGATTHEAYRALGGKVSSKDHSD